MSKGYLQSRVKLLVIAIAFTLAIDYFQGETIDTARVLTKVFTMTLIVALLSAIQYLWKSRSNA